MKLRNLLTIMVVTFLFFSSKAESLSTMSINGPTTVCAEQEYNYNIIGTPAGVFYEWTITGGAFLSTPVGATNVDVAWNNNGTITISSYSDAALTSLINTNTIAVTVEVLEPIITMDPEVGCVDVDRKEDDQPETTITNEIPEENCYNACELNTINYFSNGNPGSTFTWEVVGDYTINFQNSAQLQLQWNSVGFGSVILTETSVNGCVAETEICVKIIAKPEALFDVVPGLVVCLEQEILFNDLSTQVGDSDLTAWEWSVSDGTYQSYTESSDFSHTFTTSGLHEVILKVYNTCGCYDEYIVEIEVINDEGPDIQCPKVVCPNEKTEIYTNYNCSSYNWSVDPSHGTIISGLGTQSITVMWNDIPDGIGYVYLSTPCGQCNVASVLEIPVIGSNLTIDGPTEVCQNQQVTLTAPQIEGTFYNWSISSSPTSASIVETIHNQIVIDVTGTAPITVTVDYNSEIAGCGNGCDGSSSHILIPTAPSYVLGTQDVCVGDTEWYSILGPSLSDIKIEKPDNTTDFIANGSGYVFTEEGLHIITPNINGCIGSPLLVNAHEVPPPVDLITGETQICPNIPYVYEASNDVDGTIYSWTVTGGTPMTGVGKEIAVTWNNSGPYSITVNRANVETPNCESAPISLGIDPIVVTTAVSGDNTVCANTTEPYALSYLDGEEYNWTISPEGQGSVTSDPNSNAVDILWNNTTGLATITASVRKCNVWHDEIFVVNIDPSNSVNFTNNDADNTVCQNQSITFNADLGYTTYDWSVSPSFGGSISNSSSVNINFINSGTFNVSLLATDDCGNVSMYSEIITVLPEPPSQLSISANDIECIGGVVVSGSATLVTSVIDAITGYSFAWTHNGNPFVGTGAGTPSIIVSATGIYQVTVTNIITGCSVVETVGIDCEPASCNMPAANTGSFQFSYDNTTCGEVDFTNTGVTTAPGWTVTSNNFVHSGVNAFNQPATPFVPFTYSSFNTAGYYNVTNKLCFSSVSQPECCINISDIVPIPVVAEASANAYCDINGAYMIHLDDFSSALGDLAGYNVEWYINGALVSSMTGVSSGTTDVPLGGLLPATSYIVLLKVNVPMGSVPGMPSDYECEFATTISIPALPDPNFTIDTPGCVDLDVEFTGVLASNTTYEWTFGDGASLIQNTPLASRNYLGNTPPASTYNVNLQVTNAAGCIASSSQNVTVYSNEFGSPAVDVDPTGPICQPNLATLTYSHTGSATATNYSWSNGTTSNPNVAFEAGGYSVTVEDTYGCTSISEIVPVDIRPAPNAIITGETNYCFESGLEVELSGYAGPGLTYQWHKKPNGGTFSFLSNAAQITDITANIWQSPYEYKLIVTDPATGCTSETATTVTINPPPAQPTINQHVTNCSPHTTLLEAISPISPADFAWSNGDSGQTIDVLHGGLYEVTLTDLNTGCSSTRKFEVEGEPNLDFFPAGCYTYCENDLPLFYPGPFGSFDFWELIYNGNGIQSGSGPVSNLSITGAGEYILKVLDNGCVYASGIMDVTLDDEKCEGCEDPCLVEIYDISPTQIDGCLYSFTPSFDLGECTTIIDYFWTVNNTNITGGPSMSYQFDNPGQSYKVCLTVIAVNEQGQKCKTNYCLDFTPKCKCECDLTADIEFEQEGCEFYFFSNAMPNECTEVQEYYWTLGVNEDIIFETSEPEFPYYFEGNQPITVCVTIYGNNGETECYDTHCETVFPCVYDQKTEYKTNLNIASFTFSPNPVADQLVINGLGTLGKEWKIVVHDITGKQITNMNQNVVGSYHSISTSDWENGIYTISISDELGNVFNDKIIKID